MGNTTVKAERGNLYKFPLHENPDGIRIDEDFNVRKDYGDLEELKNSIIENGMKVPAQGRKVDGAYLLTDGHRRFKAAQMAVAEGHEVIFLLTTETKSYTETDRLIDMFTRNSGKSLTPMEEANLFARLVDNGFTTEGIAKRIGKTRQHVYNMLKLLNGTTEETQTMIEEGKVAATTVVNMMATNTPEAIEANIQKAIEENPDKKKVTAKHIEGAPTGRERKVATPAISLENEEAKEVSPVKKVKDDLPKNYVDAADKEQTPGVPSNRVTEINVNVRAVSDAVKAEVKAGAKLNKHAEHYLRLLESYGKKDITLKQLVASFTYTEAVPA